jgi:hypothetical protein
VWNRVRLWFCATRTENAQNERLFSIFDGSETATLFEQIKFDLQSWGYDSFQSQRAAKRIVEKATEAEGAATSESAEHTRFAKAIATNDDRLLEYLAAERGDGVTADDIRWYWSLHSVARVAMRLFDDELQNRMWIDRHAFNLCIEDLEQDVRRQLPVFGDPEANAPDSPLHPELRRRFALFITRTKQNPSASKKWGARLQQTTSMNALVREVIVSGDF